ncbi:MAG: carbohydrate-binding domain-containing protein [Schaalia hyovaginalis]|uniref:carbohydrate-binding domain-containing protein n=1 Tax=Schaalia hyovaginalis TaxID=29316 RepID=UPI0023F78BD0|nr:carbohydrate-binding domain-containing protein [Schaalia hyovaginalis]MCI7671592.1 carbohydrate-binding domain-containing protein [Schaalia hyovaginalis]MDY5505689.1 carbohydrate-binding domain-containing protein [Schaalia hyovaginalis]
MTDSRAPHATLRRPLGALKRSRRPLASLAVIAALALGACTSGASSAGAAASSTATASEAVAASSSAGDTTNPPTLDEALAANAQASAVSDEEWSSSDAVEVVLAGTSASSTSESVAVEDGTLRISAAGVYRLSGSYEGQIVVDAPEDARVVLILDGATITNDSGAAILAETGDDLVISLSGASRIVDTSSAAESSLANAAIYADMDLTMTGEGSLEVSSTANDAITSTDDLTILSGSISVKAGDDGLRGKDSLSVLGGTITVESGGDGLKSDEDEDATAGYVLIRGGEISVVAGGDGIVAHSDALLAGGSIDIESGGGASTGAALETSSKGVKTGVYLIVEGADLSVDSADDSLHSDGAIRLSSGTLELASGDDGIHAEVAAVLDGADVTVSQSNEGLEAGLITVADGSVDITASDDGINGSGSTSVEAGAAAAAASSDETGAVEQQDQRQAGPGGGGADFTDSGELVTISGGSLVVNAGGDGLDSNGSISITGGTTTVWGPTNDGNGALDYNGTMSVTGGTLLAVGSAGMAEAPSSTEGAGWISAALSGAQGSKVRIVDSAGTEILSFTASKAFASIVYASAEITNGADYTIEVDGSSTSVTAGQAAAGMGGAMGGPGGPGGQGAPVAPGGPKAR